MLFIVRYKDTVHGINVMCTRNVSYYVFNFFDLNFMSIILGKGGVFTLAFFFCGICLFFVCLCFFLGKIPDTPRGSNVLRVHRVDSIKAKQKHKVHVKRLYIGESR